MAVEQLDESDRLVRRDMPAEIGRGQGPDKLGHNMVGNDEVKVTATQ